MMVTCNFSDEMGYDRCRVDLLSRAPFNKN